MKQAPDYFHFLARIYVQVSGFENYKYHVWRVLCSECLRHPKPPEIISLSQLDCEYCGARFAPPVRARSLFVKQETHIITAQYPAIEQALNS